MSFVATIKQAIYSQFDAFLTQRIPTAREKTLDNRSIFIFPSKYGFAYIFLTILVFLLGTNYQNNVIILFAYLLASFFISTMLLSYFNLKGLTFKCGADPKFFAEQQAELSLKIIAPKTSFNIYSAFPNESITLTEQVKGEQSIKISIPNLERGIHTLGRVKVWSQHGFGLFTTWSWLDFGATAVVYPKVRPIPNHLLARTNQSKVGAQSGTNQFKEGKEEFHELREYRQGESLSHVSWKHLARGQGKLTKHYHEPISQDLWLTLDSVSGKNLEEKLSYLCYLVTQSTQQNLRFGFILAITRIEPNSGLVHSEQCLLALADY